MFDLIGKIVVGLIGLGVALTIGEIVREAWRAVRQIRRIARVLSGKSYARSTARQWLRAWWGELFSSYTSLQIGGFELPHDPSQPVRRWYPG